MSNELNLSELETKLYELLKEKGVLTIPDIQEINPRMVGAFGKLKSRGLANIVYDKDEPIKQRRRKIYPMIPDELKTKEETPDIDNGTTVINLGKIPYKPKESVSEKDEEK